MTLVRSPIMRKLLSGRSVSGSVPLSRSTVRRVVRLMRLDAADGVGDRRDVLGRRAAAAADDVHPAALGKLAEHARPSSAGPRSYWPISFGRPALGWQLIRARRHLLQRLQVRPHQLRAQRAVHADREQREVRDRVPERLDRPGRRRTSPRPCRTCPRPSPARGRRARRNSVRSRTGRP